jgi:hypothetical protein
MSTFVDRELQDFVLSSMNLRDSSAMCTIAKVKGRGGIGQLHGFGGRRQPGYVGQEAILYPEALGWFDHTGIYWHRAEKQYAMITQPYGLTDEKFGALQEMCNVHGLHCHRADKLSWWYPGFTSFVIVHDGIQDVFDFMFENGCRW